MQQLFHQLLKRRRLLLRVAVWPFLFSVTATAGEIPPGSSVPELVIAARPPLTAPVIPPLPAPVIDPVRLDSAEPSRYLGSHSCAATSCHGDRRRTDLVKSAFSIYQEADPHQMAGRVLYGERSGRMAERLNLPQPAWKTRECLVCHAPGAVGGSPSMNQQRFVAEGVSCEACHGGAREWLEPHRSYAWHDANAWPTASKQAVGFQETKSLTTRAGVCANCHVGTREAQVTHDLIAAGHPRLVYELSSYQSQLPVHWQRSADRYRIGPGSEAAGTYEATLWWVGQLVAADRELELLETSTVQKSAVWPELAQYDCFACHHDLQSQSSRQMRRKSDLPPGQIRWGTWNFGLLQGSPEVFVSDDLTAFRHEQQKLVGKMQSFTVDQGEITDLVRPFRKQLQQALAQAGQPRSVEIVLRQRSELLANQELLIDQGWDSSAQLYLGLVALEQGLEQVGGRPGIADRQLRLVLESLRDELAYSRSASPAAPVATYESPRYFDRGGEQTVQQLFEQYQSRIQSLTPGNDRPNLFLPPAPSGQR